MSIRFFARMTSLWMVFLALVSACNMPVASTPLPPENGEASGGMQLRFTNLTDGGTVAATFDGTGKPVVLIQVEVTGKAPMAITLEANGMTALGSDDRTVEAVNTDGSVPFTGELLWSPLNGGGEYTLVATAIDGDKNTVQVAARVTVTGVPVFTPTPPPPDLAAATQRMVALYQQLYGVTIPAPAMQRFDFPQMPGRSRWISAVYYQGQRYYIELFDDTHYELSAGPYADPLHPGSEIYYTYCKPAGLYKVLIVFVDYGNLPGVDSQAALAQVPVMRDWINQVYADYAATQGLSSAPLKIEADGAFISSPPSPGNLLTVEDIRSQTDFDANDYDFLIQIDLDRDNTYANTYWPGVFSGPGGGLALQGCGSFEDPQVRINIWSSLDDPNGIQGALFMDLSHEMSHLFGMMDSWPFQPEGLTRPDGSPGDDWIPYAMFGWTDTDGDGIIEILDPTPYGTSGPQP